MRDDDVLRDIVGVFGTIPRPEHFTDYRHCSECSEHNELLRSTPPGQLKSSDVSNPGWNPICFVTNDAFRYLVPDLVRLSLIATHDDPDWVFPMFLFHLTCRDHQDRFLACSPSERYAIARFLLHIEATRMKALQLHGVDRDIVAASDLWSGS